MEVEKTREVEAGVTKEDASKEVGEVETREDEEKEEVLALSPRVQPQCWKPKE